MIGCVMVCGRDESCLPPFIKAWKLISKIPLTLIVDINDPIKEDHGLPVTFGKWPSQGSISQPVLESLIEASNGHSAVIKLDVDCLHLDQGWLDYWNPKTMVALGQQHANNAGCFMGAAYVLSVEAARQAAITGGGCLTRAEDVGMSRKMRIINPNGVHLISRRINPLNHCACGWSDETELKEYLQYGIVHCGQRQARGKVAGCMAGLLSFNLRF